MSIFNLFCGSPAPCRFDGLPMNVCKSGFARFTLVSLSATGWIAGQRRGFDAPFFDNFFCSERINSLNTSV